MDLQQTFYLFGTIIFIIGIVVFVTALVLIVLLYYRYERFLKDSKQRAVQFKRRLSALPFLPIVGFLMRRFRARRKTS